MTPTDRTPSLVDTTLRIDGMTCHSCVSHVTRALLDLAEVRAVHVELAKGRAHVTHEGGPGIIDELVEALADAGYPAAPSA